MRVRGLLVFKGELKRETEPETGHGHQLYTRSTCYCTLGTVHWPFVRLSMPIAGEKSWMVITGRLRPQHHSSAPQRQSLPAREEVGGDQEGPRQLDCRDSRSGFLGRFVGRPGPGPLAEVSDDGFLPLGPHKLQRYRRQGFQSRCLGEEEKTAKCLMQKALCALDPRTRLHAGPSQNLHRCQSMLSLVRAEATSKSGPSPKTLGWTIRATN